MGVHSFIILVRNIPFTAYLHLLKVHIYLHKYINLHAST